MIAFSDSRDQIVESPYEEGLKYQNVINKLELARKLNLKAKFDFQEISASKKPFKVTLLSGNTPYNVNDVTLKNHAC